MNRSQLIGGIICILGAVGLAVANLALPAESVLFQIGDKNMPWVPVIILAVLGPVLIAGAVRGGYQEEAPTGAMAAQPPSSQVQAKIALNKRFETICLGLFLIMAGGFAFVPHTIIPKGLWSIGVGLIFLGLNGARYFNQIKMSGFTTFLGLLSVVNGLIMLVTLNSTLEGAIFLILLGGALLLRPYFNSLGIFGKVEQG